MSEFAAAYGLIHLDELDSIIEQNRKIHQAYLQEFSEFKELKFLDYTFSGKSNHQYVVACGASDIRNTLVDYFHTRGILLRRYFHPGCHRMEPYASHEQYQGLHLRNTDKISSEIVVFPTGTQVTPSTIKEFSYHFRKFKEANKI